MKSSASKQNDRLTNAGRQLLECLRAFICGGSAELIINADDAAERRELFSLAYIHKLLPVVCGALGSAEGLFADEEAQNWRSLAKKQAVMSAYCSGAFCAFLRELEQRDIRPVVLKGELIKRLYSSPDLRLSADEDIYLPGDAADDCAAELLAMGYEAASPANAGGSKWDENGVMAFNGSNGLHIELHKRLFDEKGPLSPATFHFAAALGRTVTDGEGDLALRALAPTDELAYLICHAAKHFYVCGFGVRVIADIAAYTMRRYDSINLKELEYLLKQCGLIRFAGGLYDIAAKHLGYDLNAYPLPFLEGEQVSGEDMLYDCLEGGVYGKSSFVRAQSAKYTSGAAAGRSRAKTLLSAAFPSRKSIVFQYPFLEKCPLLLPAAWVMRWFGYIASGRRDAQQGAVTGAKRIKLLRGYGMALKKEGNE